MQLVKIYFQLKYMQFKNPEKSDALLLPAVPPRNPLFSIHKTFQRAIALVSS